MAKVVPTGFLSDDGTVYDTPEAAIRGDAVEGMATILKETEEFNDIREVAEYLFERRYDLDGVITGYAMARMRLKSRKP